jgi:excisionase family DNA binding protein
MAEGSEHLNDVESTSRRIGVSTFTTRRLIKSGDLRAVRVGRRLLIPESEVERVMREGCGWRVGRV